MRAGICIQLLPCVTYLSIPALFITSADNREAREYDKRYMGRGQRRGSE